MVQSTKNMNQGKSKPIPLGNDYLNFKYDQEIKQQLEKDEHIVFSVEVIKYNRFRMKQARNLLLTTLHLANVKDHTFQRRIRIDAIKAMTKSTELNNNEFICHVENEYDYTFICDKREELFDHLKECYFNIKNENLPIYGVPGNVSQYATTKKDVKADIVKQPPDSFRLRAEDRPCNGCNVTEHSSVSGSTL